MFEQIKTTDFDMFSEVQEGWETNYLPLQPEKFEAVLQLAQINGLQTEIEWLKNQTEIYGASTSTGLGIVLPFGKQSEFMSKGCRVGEGDVNVFKPGEEIYAVMNPGTILVSYSIDLEVFDEFSSFVDVADLQEIFQSSSVIKSSNNINLALHKYANRILRLASKGTVSNLVYDQLVLEVISELAQAVTTTRKPTLSNAKRYKIAKAARDLIVDHLAPHPTILELCSLLNISQRTLEYAFRSVYAVSPKKFIKTKRLIAVHKDLKGSTRDRRISDVAMNYGFSELGYFARDYRAMFGELPSDTLRN